MKCKYKKMYSEHNIVEWTNEVNSKGARHLLDAALGTKLLGFGFLGLIKTPQP